MWKEYLRDLFDTALAVTAGLALGGFIVLKNMGYEILTFNPRALALAPSDWVLFVLVVAMLTLAELGGNHWREARGGQEE